MSVTFAPLSPAIGQSVTGVADIPNLAYSDKRALVRAFRESGLLLFRGLDLSDEDHIALSRVFGDLEIHPIASIRLRDHPEIIQITYPGAADFADDDPAGDAIVGKIDWHNDLSYTTTPGRGALLRAITVPPEMGETGFIDMSAVYADLPDEVKGHVDGMDVVNSFEATRKKVVDAFQGKGGYTSDRTYPPVVYPLVYPHPETGRKILAFSPGWAERIVQLNAEKTERLFAYLKGFMYQDKYIYMHDWRKGDVLLWDNLRTIHCATGYKARHRRLMYRTTLKAESEIGRLAG